MRVGLTFILVFIFSSASAQDVLDISSIDEKVNINTYLTYYLDEDRSKLIGDIALLSSGYFVPINESGLRLPKTSAQVWLKFSYRSSLKKSETFFIDFIDPSLYVIELYTPNSDGTFNISTSGTGVSQHEKAIRGNKNNLKIELEPNHEVTVFIKVYSTNNMTISAEVMDAEIALNENMNERTFIGLFYGALIILMIYNLLLFFTTRLRVFLINGFYTFLVSLFTGSADGFTAQYLHFFVDWTNGYHDVFIAAGTNVVGLFFMRDFLRVSEWSKGLNKGLLWFAYGIIIALVLVAITYPKAVFLYLSYVGILVLFVTLFIGFLAVKRKRPQASYFVTAYVIFGTFIILFVLSILRVLPYGDWVKYSIHFGYLSCISILSYGLSVKIYNLYLELLEKEKEKKTLIEIKNQELEGMVAERTKYIREKEINLRSILDTTDSSIWLIDDQYKIIEFNKVLAKDWEIAYNQKLELGENILDLTPITSRRAAWKKRYDDALESNEKAVYRDCYPVQGVDHHYEIHVFPISYGDRVTGISCFSKDITPRVNAESQLVSQNDMLVKVNQELDSFVYSASHDLKAPLASVLGLIKLIRKETDESSKGHYYDMMEKSVVRLDQFIKDIIDYSRNSRVEIQPVEIDIKSLVINSFDDLKYIEAADQTEKNINIPDNLRVTSDPTRLRVIVRNILSNAIKYGSKKGSNNKIDVSAYRENGMMILSIADNGPGIPLDQHERIFDMFYRLHESKSGTGLGLYIVKETVEKLEGTIKVISEPDMGASFQISIPSLE